MKATADISWSGNTPGKAKAGETVNPADIPAGLLAKWTQGVIDEASGEVIQEPVLVDEPVEEKR